MLQIDDLVFNAWGRRFFDHASVLIPSNAKVGLVGRNGVGKSTLFKLILGELHADGGEISLPKRARIGSVDQEHPATPVSLLDTILAADHQRDALHTELETAEPERIADIYARLMEIDADRAPARAGEILAGLGFSTADLARPMSEFSGGWRMRVALAAALFAEPDLLLLDEPTNYLDLEGAMWLEARLRKYPNAAIIISHDRELLNNSVDAILHITEARFDYYTGGYDDFERQRAERLRLQSAAKSKQDAERAHLQSFVDRFRAKASKAAQAQSRVKRLAKLPPIATAIEERVAPFTLPSPARPLAPPMLRLEGVSVGYDGHNVLRDLNLRLDTDDRIGLLGVNGAGKSTFAKMAAGALPIQSGHMQRERRMQVGWFHQHQIEALDPADTPLDIIRRARPDLGEQGHRATLAKFGIGFDKQATTVADLSGGERARLLLAKLFATPSNFLVLDEPTNDLDLETLDLLEEVIADYPGTALLVSHDRDFLDRVATSIVLAEGDGTFSEYAGGYADMLYQRGEKVPERPETRKSAPRASTEKRVRTDAAPKMNFADAHALKTLPGKIAAAELRMMELEKVLSDSGLYARDPAKFAAVSAELADIRDQNDADEERWLALEMEREALEQD